MRHVYFWVLLAGTPALPATAAPVPKAIQKAVKATALDGRWEAAEIWSGMSDVVALNPWVWDIEGERLTVYRREKGELREYDPKTKTTLVRPPGGGADDIDYVRDDGTPSVFKGTAVVEGDRLVLCFDSPGKPRPADRKPFQSGWYYVFKRVSDK